MRWVVALLMGLMLPTGVWAHGLGAEYKIDGDKVIISAFFDDDTDAEGAKIRILDAQKKLVAEGTADAKGKWSFALPSPGEYRVEVDAGAGHRARVKLLIPGISSSALPTDDAPKRTEFTRSRWRELGLGIGIITIAAITARRLLRKRDVGTKTD